MPVKVKLKSSPQRPRRHDGSSGYAPSCLIENEASVLRITLRARESRLGPPTHDVLLHSFVATAGLPAVWFVLILGVMTIYLVRSLFQDPANLRCYLALLLGAPLLGLVILLLFFLIGVYNAAYAASFTLAEEVIEIDEQFMTIRRGIERTVPGPKSSGRFPTFLSRIVFSVGLPLVVDAPRRYRIEHIRNLRFSLRAPQPLQGLRYRWPLGIPPTALAFDYGSQTIYFARGITLSDALRIGSAIRQRFPTPISNFLPPDVAHLS